MITYRPVSGRAKMPYTRLLNSLLRELSSSSRALTSFELRIGLTNNIESAFTFNNLAIFVAALHRS